MWPNSHRRSGNSEWTSGESEPDGDAERFMPASSASELQNDFDFSSDGSFKGKNVDISFSEDMVEDNAECVDNETNDQLQVNAFA